MDTMALTSLAWWAPDCGSDAGVEAESGMVPDDAGAAPRLTTEDQPPSHPPPPEIRRCNDDKGWAVNVSLGQAHYKVFDDTRYGGKESALDVARTWARMVTNKRCGEVADGPAIRRTNRHLPANALGVYRVASATWRGEVLKQLRICWVAVSPAQVSPPRRRSFSVFRFGEETAFQMATATRRKFEHEAAGLLDAGFSPELRHIHRIERKRFGIWQVSIKCSRSDRIYRKPFSDLFYGDKTLSLTAAKAWRDEMVRRHHGESAVSRC